MEALSSIIQNSQAWQWLQQSQVWEWLQHGPAWEWLQNTAVICARYSPILAMAEVLSSKTIKQKGMATRLIRSSQHLGLALLYTKPLFWGIFRVQQYGRALFTYAAFGTLLSLTSKGRTGQIVSLPARVLNTWIALPHCINLLQQYQCSSSLIAAFPFIAIVLQIWAYEQ